jgi:anti-sigma factor RsiW
MTMKEPKDFYNDPQLTAYALGELEGDERAAVEAALQTDATARAAVEAIRATARQLEAALASEPEIISPPFKVRHIAPYATARKLVQFPYWLVGGLAAAGFAVVLVLHEQTVVRVEQQEEAMAARQDVLKHVDSAARRKMMAALAEAMARKAMSQAKAAAAKPSPYTEVTFPVAAIPVGNVETQINPQAAAADKAMAPGASMAANQPAEEQIKLEAFQVSAAPAHGYSASETMTTNRVALPIREYYAGGDFISVAQSQLSMFGLDVGRANYALVRQFLQAGKRPPADEVYIEELVNYFPYAYTTPRDHAPLAATLEVAAAPWAPTHRLVRIGLKAREITGGGTPVTVAKDVTVQVAFNPAKVQSYRLIGYNDSPLKEKNFSKNVIPPAGDLRAGHAVTALYEIVPVGVEPPATPGGEALKYQKTAAEGEGREARGERSSSSARATADKTARDQKAGNFKSEILNPEILIVTVRYTPIEGGAGRQLEFPLTDRGATFAEASTDFKFAAAVAGFGLILRESPLKGNATLAAVEQWAGQGLGPDAGGYRAEFIGLVHLAEKLKE